MLTRHPAGLQAARDEYNSLPSADEPAPAPLPAAAAAATAAGGGAAAPRPASAEFAACPICFDKYSGSTQHQHALYPRVLVACGHTFCEGCLDQMLQPLPLKNGGKRLECPVCRKECRVQVPPLSTRLE